MDNTVNLDPDFLNKTNITKKEISPFRTPMAQASFSRLSYYKNCPLAFRFKYIDKLATLAGPIQKDKQGNIKPPAYVRGSNIHVAMDDYINARTDILRPELFDLRFEIDEARELMKTDPKRVLTEQNKFFDLDYNLIDMGSLAPEELGTTSAGDPCPLHYHVLIIIDLLIFSKDFTHATVIDLKSGKIHPVKHGSQTKLYALFTAIEYPQVENLTTQLWYCDANGKIQAQDFTRKKILMTLNFWNRQIGNMHSDITFKANPHEQNCMFCDFGLQRHSNKWINKTNDCQLSLDKRDRI